MSSIMQSKFLKTMYMTAKELGIESFLVDLRHLCAHGQVMPSLDVFQRTAVYCLNWLHTFYWKREINLIQNATVEDVRQKSFVEFEETVIELFTIYDSATEALYRKHRLVSDIDATKMDPIYLDHLIAYADYNGNERLSIIVTKITNELTELASKQSKTRGNAQLYCEILFRSKYFIETAGELFLL